MGKNVELHLETWRKMRNSLSGITESGVSSSSGSTWSGSSTSSGGPGMSSYTGVGQGATGFSKRISDIVDLSEKVKRLIDSKDSDGAVSFTYHDDRVSASQLQGKLQSLETYASNVHTYLNKKIDNPFYVNMDKVGYDLEQLNILNYKAPNRVGYKTTQTIQDTYGQSVTLPYQPSEIGILELYKVDNPYQRRLKESYDEMMKNVDNTHGIKPEDILVSQLHQYNFSYDSLYESQSATEMWRDLTLTGGALILGFFCPPAGGFALLTLSGADLYSAFSGKDWGTGRSLDDGERWMRGVFAVLDFVPGIDFFKAWKSGGAKAAGIQYMQGLLGINAVDGVARHGDDFATMFRRSDDVTDHISKQLDELGGHTVTSGGKQLDDITSSGGKKFSLNEPRPVDNYKSFDRKTFVAYLKDIEYWTKRKIPSNQLDELENALRNFEYSKLSPAETAKHRARFNEVKDSIISEWELRTGQTWPTYTQDVIGKNGKIVRRAGDRYDAHHIIENSFGGQHEWWNIHPARFPNEHQAGIHGAGSISKNLFN